MLDLKLGTMTVVLPATNSSKWYGDIKEDQLERTIKSYAEYISKKIKKFGFRLTILTNHIIEVGSVFIDYEGDFNYEVDTDEFLDDAQYIQNNLKNLNGSFEIFCNLEQFTK